VIQYVRHERESHAIYNAILLDIFDIWRGQYCIKSGSYKYSTIPFEIVRPPVGYRAVWIFDGEWEWEGVDMAGSIGTVLQFDDVAILDGGFATIQEACTGRRRVRKCQRQNGECCE